MSNDDWERWTDAWNTEKKSMPDVIKRAKNDRLRAIFAITILALLITFLTGSAVWELVHSQSRSESASAVLSLATLTGLGVGTALTMRGTLRLAGRSPLALLDGLERRHRGRQRLLTIVNVFAAANLAGGLGVAFLQRAEPPTDGHSPSGLLVRYAVSMAAVVVVNVRVGRKIRRDLAESEAARQLLGEPLGD